jgi:hypothetical protein
MVVVIDVVVVAVVVVLPVVVVDYGRPRPLAPG